MLLTYWEEILLSILAESDAKGLQVRISNDLVLLNRKLLSKLFEAHPDRDCRLKRVWLIHLLFNYFQEDVINIGGVC